MTREVLDAKFTSAGSFFPPPILSFSIFVYQTISFVCLTHSSFLAFFPEETFYWFLISYLYFFPYNYYFLVCGIALCFAVEHFCWPDTNYFLVCAFNLRVLGQDTYHREFCVFFPSKKNSEEIWSRLLRRMILSKLKRLMCFSFYCFNPFWKTS